MPSREEAGIDNEHASDLLARQAARVVNGAGDEIDGVVEEVNIRVDFKPVARREAHPAGEGLFGVALVKGGKLFIELRRSAGDALESIEPEIVVGRSQGNQHAPSLSQLGRLSHRHRAQ